MTKKINYTEFGNFYFSLPKVLRMRMMQGFKEEGISPITVRTWMYRPVVPKAETHPVIERITKQTVLNLFPY